MADEPKLIPWESITSLDGDGPTNGPLKSLDALRQAWRSFLDSLPESDRVAIRQRSLRRLAVETGIIERLYDVDWGLTLTLVAEGFAREVIERAGGSVDDDTLETLRAQRDSLQMVVDFVRDDRRLSVSFIKELHAALTRTQFEHDVVDSLGRRDRHALLHGEWNTQPNRVQLEDGTICECAPPEQTASEMDRLLALYEELEGRPAVHPLVKATWLHHRFVQIHPFGDGNGRVARALTLLVLEKHRYAPLVVDRFHRAKYMEAIQIATGGDLSPMVELFVRLESAALTGELERPEPAAGGAAAEIAHALAAQIAALRRHQASEREQKLKPRIISVGARIDHWFQMQERAVSEAFRSQGVPDADVRYYPYDPERAHYFRGQIIRSAQASGHYADFDATAKWWHLRVKLSKEGLQASFIASLHGAGRGSGVMAVTTIGELRWPDDPEQQGHFEALDTANDAFRFAYTESQPAISDRGSELEQLLDDGLGTVLARLIKELR